MDILNLEELDFYKVLINSGNSNANVYAGVLSPIASNVNYLLEYIRASFKEYPCHSLQHSYRILYYIYEILEKELINSLTNAEIFCIIMAALFHDTGMAMYTLSADVDKIRNEHHEFSSHVLDRFFNEKMQLLDYRDRLKEAIVFACRAHGMDVEEVYKNKLYNKKDKINGEVVRYSLLASFIRIGDLLDLDLDRVNEFALSLFSDSFTALSSAHNKRHLNVINYFYNSSELNITVYANDIDEYKIWTSWFGYIKTEILHINTYLNNYNIRLPKPETIIEKNPNANFEIEELRFEIDSTGGIWEILSQSIYTDEFDFIRELIQNAIDAMLLPFYMDENIQINNQSPRSWNISDIFVYIGYSNKRQELYVIDTGIGMDFMELKNFLFKISGSGNRDLKKRPFKFPAISKFGIGFVSCLINASIIEIYTKKAESLNLQYVNLDAKGNFAIMQKISESEYVGTTIKLKVNKHFSGAQISDFIKKTFRYPSIGIVYFDIDHLQDTSNRIMPGEDFNQILNRPFNLVSHLNFIDKECGIFLNPLNNNIRYLEYIMARLSELCDWIKENESYDKNYSDKNKFKDFTSKLQDLNKAITLVEGIPPFPLTNDKINVYKLFTDNDDLFTEIDRYKIQIVEVIDQNKRIRNQYQKSSVKYPVEKVSFNLGWKYCIIELNDDFYIVNIDFSDSAPDLTNKKGIIFLNHEINNFNDGYEYASVNSFLFSDGQVNQSISRFMGHCFRRISKETYDKPIVIGTEDVFDYFDVIDCVSESYDDLDPCAIDDIFSTIFCEDNGFYLCDNITKIDLDRNSTIPSMRKPIVFLLDRYLSDNNFEENELNVKINSLYRILNGDAFDLCQDGIHLPNDLKGLFPIGFSKISCNLTSGSRLILNVTRHKISETEISEWLESTALTIQKTIFSTVKKCYQMFHYTLMQKRSFRKTEVQIFFQGLYMCSSTV